MISVTLLVEAGVLRIDGDNNDAETGEKISLLVGIVCGEDGREYPHVFVALFRIVIPSLGVIYSPAPLFELFPFL